MMTRSMIERLLVRPDELFSGHLDEFHLTEGREEENIQNKKGKEEGEEGKAKIKKKREKEEKRDIITIMNRMLAYE